VIVNYIREYQIENGVPPGQAYNTTMYVLAGLLVLGLVCNLLVRPVAEKHFMAEEAPQRAAAPAAGRDQPVQPDAPGPALGTATHPVLTPAAWFAIGLPLSWGVWITLTKAAALFR
jgi:hypothetical protein